MSLEENRRPFSEYKKDKISGNGFCPFLLCNRKNKPPTNAGEGRSLDLSKNSCARINVGLQTISTEDPKMDINSF